MRTTKVAVCLFLFLAPQLLLAQGVNSGSAEDSCRRFVQGFYDWYVPKALKESDTPALDLALKVKSSAFDARLLQALREDSAARAKVADEIVGLDFDPFLNTQDLGQRYVVGKVTRKGDGCRADVHVVVSGKRSAKPDVVPELVLKQGRWLFVNFHYPESKDSKDENLLSILDVLRKDRK